jgi:hypothetical protein
VGLGKTRDVKNVKICQEEVRSAGRRFLRKIFELYVDNNGLF